MFFNSFVMNVYYVLKRTCTLNRLQYSLWTSESRIKSFPTIINCSRNTYQWINHCESYPIWGVQNCSLIGSFSKDLKFTIGLKNLHASEVRGLPRRKIWKCFACETDESSDMIWRIFSIQIIQSIRSIFERSRE